MLPQMGHNNPPTELEIVQQRLCEEDLAIAKELNPLLEKDVPERIDDEEIAGKITERIKSLTSMNKSILERHKAIKAPYLACGNTLDEWKRKYEAKIKHRKELLQKPVSEFLDRKEAEERQRLLEAEEQRRKEAEELAEQARKQAEADMQEAADCEGSGLSETAQELMESAVIKAQEADMLEKKALKAKPSELTKSRSIYGGATASNSRVWVGEVENYTIIDTETLRDYFSKDAIDKALKAYVKDGGRLLRGAKIYETTKLNVR